MVEKPDRPPAWSDYGVQLGRSVQWQGQQWENNRSGSRAFSEAELGRTSFCILRPFLDIPGVRDAPQGWRAESGPRWQKVCPRLGRSVGRVDGGVRGWNKLLAEFPACHWFLHEHFWRPAVCWAPAWPSACSHSRDLSCPGRGGPTALRASGPPEVATVSFLLYNTVLTRQVLFWVPAVTTKLHAGSSRHCFHLLLIEWMQRQQEIVNGLLTPVLVVTQKV